MAFGPSSRRLIDKFLRIGISSAVTFLMEPFSLSKKGFTFSKETTCFELVAILLNPMEVRLLSCYVDKDWICCELCY